ncbi:uroporphyrinogen-III synthase [Balneolales bacterium ANBcel1]|nr:uroporphyrinogen-III synthase [Balneolales bacterium ANBcel1]
MTAKPLRIGTRDSLLATWQARHVATILGNAGYATELIYIKTEGDRVLDTPLPLMGGKGVFTKALDDALLAGEIDLAVHSLKDIPTRIPSGLCIAAVGKREETSDVIVFRKALREDIASGNYVEDTGKEGKRKEDSVTQNDALINALSQRLSDRNHRTIIASSSNRRIGQWLAKYPHHSMVDIRGNIQTRLRKLYDSDWDGAIFAAAGLRRLELDHAMHQKLDWMIPAPAQGALGVMTREDAVDVRTVLRNVHDEDAALCTKIERDVLHTLEGGCSAPVGALAEIAGGQVRLRVNTVYPDGSGMISFEMQEARDNAEGLGVRAAEEALKRGADALIRDLSKNSGQMTEPIDGDGGGPTDSEGKISSKRQMTKPGKQTVENRKVVISTRPSASGDMDMANAQGILLLDYPAFYYRWITPTGFVIDSVFAEPTPEAWVFTSRRGVEGWWRVWKGLSDETKAGSGTLNDKSAEKGREPRAEKQNLSVPPIYVVGEKTRSSTEELFPEAETRMAGEHHGSALALKMVRDGIRSVVHFCSVDRRSEIRDIAKKFQVEFTEVEVYRSCPVTDPQPIDTAVDAIFFFSPNGVAEFMRLYGLPEGDWKAVAVGGTTAEVVRKKTGRVPLVADSPSFQEMIKLI